MRNRIETPPLPPIRPYDRNDRPKKRDRPESENGREQPNKDSDDKKDSQVDEYV